MLIETYRLREFFATSQRWAHTEVIIVSSQQLEYKDPPQLHLFQIQAGSNRPKETLPLAIEYAKALRPIVVKDFRHALPTGLGSLLSNHLVEIHKTYLATGQTLVEKTARRYTDLTTWGEANSAKVLAEEDEISIRTMHSRLMNARKKGLLESPGTGFRFNN